MSITTVPIRPIKKGSLTKFWVGVGLVVALAGAGAYYGTAESVVSGANDDQFLAMNAKDGDVVTTPSGLQYKVLQAGEGPSPTLSDTTLVKYEGRLRDGSVFDANEQTPMPVAGVVPGFSEGLQVMQKGGKYRLWIPSKLGYGEASPGPSIPANSLLIFDVELKDFISNEQMEAMRRQFEAQQQQQRGAAPTGR